MNRKKLKLVVSAMSILLAVQSPGAVLADTGQETAVEAQVSTEETVSEPGTEEILNGMGTEITQESEGYQEEILPGTADEVLPGTGEEESQILRGTADIAEAQNPTVQEALDKAEKYLQSAVTSPVVDTIGGEWSVMAMARAGYLSDTAKANYLANLYMKLDDTNGVLHNAKYTEYSRVIMALSSIGTDPSRINGYNLLKPLAKFEKVNQQGINGTIFALIALDTKDYEIPEREGEGTQTTRENLIQKILSQELSGGGWALQGKVADPDITAMAMQALAPYKERADVGAALNRGLDKLASMQDADGGYGSSYISEGEEPVKNLESTAQVVIALSAIDVSLLEQDKFMKNGKTLLDEILSVGNGIDHITRAYPTGRAGQMLVRQSMSIGSRHTSTAFCYIIIIQHLVICFVELLGIRRLIVPETIGVRSPFSIDRHFGFSAFPFLGRDHDHTVGTTGTIQRVGSSIFQYGHRLDIVGVDQVQVTVERHTVHYDQRFRIRRNRTETTDSYRGRTTRL